MRKEFTNKLNQIYSQGYEEFILECYESIGMDEATVIKNMNQSHTKELINKDTGIVFIRFFLDEKYLFTIVKQVQLIFENGDYLFKEMYEKFVENPKKGE